MYTSASSRARCHISLVVARRGAPSVPLGSCRRLCASGSHRGQQHFPQNPCLHAVAAVSRHLLHCGAIAGGVKRRLMPNGYVAHCTMFTFWGRLLDTLHGYLKHWAGPISLLRRLVDYSGGPQQKALTRSKLSFSDTDREVDPTHSIRYVSGDEWINSPGAAGRVTCFSVKTCENVTYVRTAGRPVSLQRPSRRTSA